MNEINKVVVDIAAGAQEQATGLSECELGHQPDGPGGRSRMRMEGENDRREPQPQAGNRCASLARVAVKFLERATSSPSRASAPVRAPQPRKPVLQGPAASAGGSRGSAATARKPEADADADWKEF